MESINSQEVRERGRHGPVKEFQLFHLFRLQSTVSERPSSCGVAVHGADGKGTRLAGVRSLQAATADCHNRDLNIE
jgi:hypothetical protein